MATRELQSFEGQQPGAMAGAGVRRCVAAGRSSLICGRFSLLRSPLRPNALIDAVQLGLDAFKCAAIILARTFLA